MAQSNMINRLLLSLYTVIIFIATKFPTHSAAITTTTTNETDLQALLDVKNHIKNDPFQILTSWNGSNHHFCNWQGITCGQRHKRVTILNIAELHLVGTLSPYIGNLTFLVSLDVSGNELSGDIPTSFGQFKSIKLIDLSRNKLSGRIPASLENLTFMTTLDLSFNMLQGQVPKSGVFSDPGTFSIVGNEKLCGGIESLKLPVCPKDTQEHGKLSTHIIIVLAICIPLALVSVFGCIYTIFCIRSSKRVHYSTYAYKKQSLKISYGELHSSTNGFSSENLIGDGKYGSVYRGVINEPSEKVVAVKVLKLQVKGTHKCFLAECKALRSIRHRNLVKIITSCSSIDFKGNDFKALILEYVPNGSLDEWLHNENPSKKLGLLERLNIAIDIASALDYLHNQYGTPIIHRDIKPSNVLLDDDLHAKVSDFGIAKFLPAAIDKSHHKESTSTGIRGTIGYVAPEYGMGGDVSAQRDIYSYGILLLEMFTGKRPTEFREDCSLHNYVKTALPHHVAEIIDPQLLMVLDNGDCSSLKIESCCLSILRIGVYCSAEMHKERMDINDALNILQDVRNELQDHVHVINT